MLKKSSFLHSTCLLIIWNCIVFNFFVGIFLWQCFISVENEADEWDRLYRWEVTNRHLESGLLFEESERVHLTLAVHRSWVVSQNTLPECYGLNVCVPLIFICWNLIPQDDNIRRWDLREEIYEISALLKEAKKAPCPSALLSYSNSLLWPEAFPKQDMESVSTLTLDFQSPKPWKINVCCL